LNYLIIFGVKINTMNQRILSILLLASAFIFNSCDKNDEVPPSPTDYIIKSSWKFSSAKASGADVTAQIPACFKDNTITFVASGQGTVNEGAVGCVPPAPANFTWSFQNNGAQINLSAPLFPGGSSVFNVVLLNDVNLILSQSVTIPPATTPITVELTFIH
jgi:hypothetical protein